MFKDPYPLEMFRRALVEDDLQARQWVQDSYRETVLDWLRSHPRKEEVYRFSGENYYITQTFTRFWQLAAGNSGLEYNTPATALKYLRACLNGVLLDSLRVASSPEAWPGKNSNESSKLWRNLQALLPDVREQRLAYLLYHCGLKPAEVVRVCPQEFSDVQEISCLRLHILERLVRNEMLLVAR